MVWRFFKLDTLLAAFVLAVMALLAFTSAWNDTVTYDEDAHIGAGILYLTQKDMRLNPEHPPLVKDLAALPLLAIPQLVVPIDHPSWTEETNGQWDFGKAFLFESGNNPDLIMRLARIMPMVLMLLLGAVLFWAVREISGVLAAFFALLLYVFSPTIIAHGRLVTTDVAAALGAFLATYLLLRYLAKPGWLRLAAAGMAFGVAESFKFSLILLIPYFGALALGWWILALLAQKEKAFSSLLRYLGGTVVIGVLGYALFVYPLYAWHVWDYPEMKQVADIHAVLANHPNQLLAGIPERMAHIPFLRPLAQYAFGVTMATQRVTGGNTTYFLGEISAEGWWYYFPVIYAIKEALASHILVLIALITGLFASRKAIRRCVSAPQTPGQGLVCLAQWKRKHFVVIAFLLWVIFYFAVSVNGKLNIGVRHLIPVFPFVFALTAIGLARWLSGEQHINPSWAQTFLDNLKRFFATGAKGTLIVLLFTLLGAGTILAWPHYLAYFNMLAGGSSGGYRLAVDSNLDWGQDLKRLAQFIKSENINAIAVDYFGWAPPERYIGNAAVNYWWADRGKPSGWFAVSATFKQGQCAVPGAHFADTTQKYCFLNAFTPKAVIGHSIFVYHLP